MSELIKNERLFTVLRAPHLSEKRCVCRK
jgi:hypothetical protein